MVKNMFLHRKHLFTPIFDNVTYVVFLNSQWRPHLGTSPELIGITKSINGPKLTLINNSQINLTHPMKK